MIVSDAPSGSIIRVIHSPNDPNGNLYKLEEHCSVMSFRFARKRFTGEKITLAGKNQCKIIEGEVDGF